MSKKATSIGDKVLVVRELQIKRWARVENGAGLINQERWDYFEQLYTMFARNDGIRACACATAEIVYLRLPRPGVSGVGDRPSYIGSMHYGFKKKENGKFGPYSIMRSRFMSQKQQTIPVPAWVVVVLATIAKKFPHYPVFCGTCHRTAMTVKELVSKLEPD